MRHHPRASRRHVNLYSKQIVPGRGVFRRVDILTFFRTCLEKKINIHPDPNCNSNRPSSDLSLVWTFLRNHLQTFLRISSESPLSRFQFIFRIQKKMYFLIFFYLYKNSSDIRRTSSRAYFPTYIQRSVYTFF